jgi:hypothetical protein
LADISWDLVAKTAVHLQDNFPKIWNLLSFSSINLRTINVDSCVTPGNCKTWLGLTVERGKLSFVGSGRALGNFSSSFFWYSGEKEVDIWVVCDMVE